MNGTLVIIFICCIFQTVFPIGLDNPDDSERNRIIGGVDVPRTDIKFFCSLYFPDREGREHHCGCAVVNATWAVSSAGCVHNKNEEDLMIMAADGAHYVSKIVVHGGQDVNTFVNDISVIEVKQKFNESSVVPVLYKPPLGLEKVEEGTELHLYGFGRLNESDVYPTEVQMLKVKAIDRDRCTQFFKDEILDSQFCTLPKLNEGLCLGDTGSPLILNQNNTNYLVGVANSAIPCGKGYPDVFADVTQLWKFINRTISIDSSEIELI